MANGTVYNLMLTKAMKLERTLKNFKVDSPSKCSMLINDALDHIVHVKRAVLKKDRITAKLHMTEAKAHVVAFKACKAGK